MNGRRPLVVIVGAGFGGLNAAKALRAAPVDIALVDRRNYHLFQPLLYQVATAGLAPSEIAHPIRAVFRRQRNLTFHLAEVTSIDLADRRLITTTGALRYDYLIIAVGSQANYFGLESVARNGFDLKDLHEAEAIRSHTLKMFEAASLETDAAQREALRTFVVVGAGPTGVEFSGALSELIRMALNKDFPRITTADVRVILIEKLETLLPGFPPELGRAARAALERKHVEVKLGEAVADFDGRRVRLASGEVIPAHTLIWAAGVRAREVLDTLSAGRARQGRVVVTPTLQVPDHPEVFVIGDAAYREANGQPLPMMAPVAIQQAKTAALNAQNLIAGRPLAEFEYRDPGSLATIGRNAAVARIGRFKFYGFVAWALWLVVHLYWLIGFRNRLFVMLSWAWAYIFLENSVRLITPGLAEARTETPAAEAGTITTSDNPATNIIGNAHTDK